MEDEKLASLSHLVAGIAHELNTPIGNGLLAVTTLSAMAEGLQSSLAGPLKRSVLLDQVGKIARCSELLAHALQRAGKSIANFKLVAAEQEGEYRGYFDLSEILRHLAEQRRDELRQAHCALGWQAPARTMLDSYPDSLLRVLNLLVDNALLHAFDGAGPARIEIVVRAAPGQPIEISFSDNGAGIAPEALPHVFDPFFTTKMGSRTGLGLTIAHNTVQAVLGGAITITPALPRGTRIAMRLPSVAPTAPQRPWRPAAQAPPGP